MKTDTNQSIPLDPFGFFDIFTEDAEVSISFAKAVEERKDLLAEEAIQNLIDGGIISKEERGLKAWLLKYDLPTLTVWLVQSHVLKEMELKRLGLSDKGNSH